MNVNSLNFNEFESSCLNLTPIYVAREASFLISKNTNYSITNLFSYAMSPILKEAKFMALDYICWITVSGQKR